MLVVVIHCYKHGYNSNTHTHTSHTHSHTSHAHSHTLHTHTHTHTLTHTRTHLTHTLTHTHTHTHTPHTLQAVTEWPENYVQNWMSSLRLNDYITKFQEAGVNRGADLARVDDNMLEERVGIADEAHRQIILECLDELCKGVSSTVSI